MSSKSIPIMVVVPGSGGDTLWLTPSEARRLSRDIVRELNVWQRTVEKAMGSPNARLRAEKAMSDRNCKREDRARRR